MRKIKKISELLINNEYHRNHLHIEENDEEKLKIDLSGQKGLENTDSCEENIASHSYNKFSEEYEDIKNIEEFDDWENISTTSIIENEVELQKINQDYLIINEYFI